MTPTIRKITRTGITVVEIAKVNMTNTPIRHRHREASNLDYLVTRR